MQQYSTEPRTRKKYFRGYGISTFGREYKRQLLDIGLDATKTASKKNHKAGEFVRNKIADGLIKSSNDKVVKVNENPRNVKEIILPEKRLNIKHIKTMF